MAANQAEQQLFYEQILSLKEAKDIGFLEAFLLYCEETELEIAVAAELTNECLKLKLESDAEKLNLLKKKRTLF